jgi:S-adenosylmethionine-diacylglycerol 3-amino-3-carboxypropyl transferase
MNSPEHSLPQWVRETASMPIAFAQVREDPRLDLDVLDLAGGNDIGVLIIASGGCTAAALAASGRLRRLHLVDMNPAQIALCRLKLHLLQIASPQERAAILGHAPMPLEERRARLAGELGSLGLPETALGPPSPVASLGPDHAGRYELVFFHWRQEMQEFAEELESLLELQDRAECSARMAPQTPLGRAMDDAFDRIMALPNLVRLFSAEATRNSYEPFFRHFARRTRHALASLPATDNPWLWQLLLGRFPEGAPYPWLNASYPSRMPALSVSNSTMDAALSDFSAEFDFIHLSNILDWLSPDQGRRTLALVGQALRPGGYVLIRQLNSTLDIPALAPEFEWLVDVANAMHAHDRSFFYRQLHLGRKRGNRS